jgi:hypothetical protein
MFDYPTELEIAYSTDAEYRRCIRSLIKDKRNLSLEGRFDADAPRRDHNERRAGLRRDFGE